MHPQNPVDGTIVDVSALGVKLPYPDASLTVRPARDRKIEVPGRHPRLWHLAPLMAPTTPEHFGISDGAHYLTLELIEGTDLRAALRHLRKRGETLDPGLTSYVAHERPSQQRGQNPLPKLSDQNH